ncbi:MAG TPA: hypothetical protein PJ993_00980 [Candidatus Saccharibacteria bacterium]|nr:hypothetical protein [Candidatus Saccharibacteria bacterium]HMT39499.1 hypothetical protein [Candidatus Saccharibacteria bacterium]
MKRVEGGENKHKKISHNSSSLETRAILFAAYSSFSSIQKSSLGYIEELNFNPQSKNQSIKKSLLSINAAEEKQVHLIELLISLLGEKQHKVSAVHPEYLFERISSINGRIKFRAPVTYQKSIISIDETIFCDSLNVILSCLAKTKRLNLNFRKRDKYFVIKISSDKPDWINLDIIDNIHNLNNQYGLTLEQLVVSYSINLLKTISVSTHFRHFEGKYSINLRLPSASQLNVFD